jgi:hypothetical protein
MARRSPSDSFARLRITSSISPLTAELFGPTPVSKKNSTSYLKPSLPLRKLKWDFAFAHLEGRRAPFGNLLHHLTTLLNGRVAQTIVAPSARAANTATSRKLNMHPPQDLLR